MCTVDTGSYEEEVCEFEAQVEQNIELHRSINAMDAPVTPEPDGRTFVAQDT